MKSNKYPVILSLLIILAYIRCPNCIKSKSRNRREIQSISGLATSIYCQV